MSTGTISNPILRLQPNLRQRHGRRITIAAGIAGGIILIYVALAIFGGWLAPFSPTDFNM